MNPTIFIAHYKDPEIIQTDIYKPLQVGKARTNIDLKLPYSDDTGDNISDQNHMYGELTGLYWIWKNIDFKAMPYVGFCHYRRYLKLSDMATPNWQLNWRYRTKKAVVHMPISEFLNTDETDLDTYLDNRYDIICNRPFTLRKPMKAQFLENHIKEDWYFLEEVLIKRYGEKKATQLYSMKKIILGNLFIMKPHAFDAYCSWLFGLIDEFKHQVKPSPYPMQGRVFAYMSERLITMFMALNKDRFSIKELPFYHLTDFDGKVDYT